jgi:hypothetical protein
MDKLSEVDEESDSDSDEETYDSESDKIDDLEVIELEPETMDLEEKSIHVLKIEPELEPKLESVSELELEPKVESELLNQNMQDVTSTPVSYSNMTLNELKKLIITKGLSTNPNKLKRAEILKLLEEETI